MIVYIALSVFVVSFIVNLVFHDRFKTVDDMTTTQEFFGQVLDFAVLGSLFIMIVAAIATKL